MLGALARRAAYDRSPKDHGQVLIIIADNEIPAAYVHQFEQEAFSYERPAIYRAVHPELAEFETIPDR